MKLEFSKVPGNDRYGSKSPNQAPLKKTRGLDEFKINVIK